MKNQYKNIGIIGDGAWGTTLAIILADKGLNVTVWGAFPEYTKVLNEKRENVKFLAGIKLPKAIHFTNDLSKTINSSDLVVLATPSQYLFPVLKKIKKSDYKGRPFVSVIKGIETRTLMTMSQLIKKELGEIPFTVLSGPTIALEVAKKIPTTAVAASENLKLARVVQELFSCAYFRVYTNSDVIGVELCGSVKNVIALACGVCDGLGFGTNTKAALLTRGLAEMVRLGRAMKVQEKTFFGLTGLGDLATTCFSPNSRNRFVGNELGRGRSMDDILKSMDSVAEGVPTAKAIFRLSKKLKIEMPITKSVYQIIYSGRNPKNVVMDLMGRSLKAE